MGLTRLYGPPSHNGASYLSINEFMMDRRTGPNGAPAPKRANHQVGPVLIKKVGVGPRA